MIYFLIFSSVVFIVLLISGQFKNTTIPEKLEMIIMCFLVGLTVWIVLSRAVWYLKPKHWEEIERKTLIYLKSNSEIEGGFILGYGQIGSTQYYTWNEKRGDGSLVQQKVKAGNNVLIYEDNTLVNTGILVVSELKIDGKIPRFLLLESRKKILLYKFILPVGSMKREFDF